ncbi:MAG: acyl-CoA dehydrogenase family protein [Bacteroidetes bacterium]|nr:acyl-CoA dehydrogenase family protein [Bacteroidota bacterium]MBU1719092.1 acyl-CoA dehydrogenase family protein [Bacteroidota bacterium]
MENNKSFTGGDFLVRQTEASEVFTPEEFNEEQRMIAQTCQDFLDTEVMTVLDRIDALEPGLMREVLVKSGEMGLLGVSVPEELNGFGQSFVTSMIASEVLGAGYSYAVAWSAHTGIGSLPILYYGNDEQRQKYSTKLATGEMIGAYCLTEPNAGSDANSGTSRVVLSEDGKHYILNGQKMWITNGGFADVFTVFAKIDNDRVLSAFIVESDWEGVTLNPEEKKMGIKGSSTRQIFFNDVKVPVENLLGKRGEGFRIALNILHVGRVKLGGNVLGSAKNGISCSVNYANERKQFGQPISAFGAIKFKLAEQVIRTFANESAVYRASRNIDQATEKYLAEGKEKYAAVVEAIAQYAIEAAILKVYGSEALDYVVDEMVQIYGGMGFSAEAAADRSYRDSRINRIFEGTNEINRMVIIDTTMKKAMRNELEIFAQANELAQNIASIAKPDVKELSYFDEKHLYIENWRKASVLMLGLVYNKLNKQFSTEQEITMSVSDMIIQLYNVESVLLRVEKLAGMKSESEMVLYKDMLDVVLYDAAFICQKSAIDALNCFMEGDELCNVHSAIKNLTWTAPVNVRDARRRIADYLIDQNRYCFPTY